VGDIGASHPLPRYQCKGGRDEEGHRDARSGWDIASGMALPLKPLIEPAPKVTRGLDCLCSLQRQHTPPHGGVVATAGGTQRKVTLETTKLAWGGDQPVANIRVPLDELVAGHGATIYYRWSCAGFRGRHEAGGREGGARGVPRYSRSGSINCAKLLRALLRRLFTVPRLHPVMSAISA
jgi:hypothetical protein